MAEKAEKLQAFVWEGKDRKGNKSTGELTGANLALVKAPVSYTHLTLPTICSV